ncbi:DNA polymerase III subunit gamma/tau [Erysipelothrix rhusiopathiae]|uniref:DNA polymerase III subunit gamma/tau n=1 Tax=Erysipelothrix rhusiopathiae TaxID=1648 RepID=UPI000210B39E|nr:DNA polymerase III subunit gamma/tau [Erysipelothrix rhusiopathiae]AGN25013.1 DNA polymerase III subunits gamma and tau [Erysipelothrix rhusiopathiae SY1027]AMS10262.1 DNA polymerase III subunit gamma/tau [Erysipelothrix rhusiopathiae]AOO67396.1 DNA polymerase III, subunit gamma and tau [Erysipelothrix rhusiopathiae]AWU40701.1 DNA polymerase III subunit gamma/tau [Erysipelothrix rhusiopathiae]MCG4436436.1 DNA polymerase III subunit gamma/tau [Erysipelothrix rhusiopathiae]
MSYQSLYRKYRPAHLDEVVGQEHVVNVLKNSITKNKISHAYLFCGPRGTGKTSIAKLFARAVNCENPDQVICGTCDNCLAVADGTHPDLIEIDAASNNGVDEIRGLIEKVKYTPILGKYKVYIIDEVHMLSQGAFNALLKTLEEPPSHVVFILATTEIHKVLPTIISRCQRYDFNRIGEVDIAKRLDYVLNNENVEAEQGVSKLIASLSGGGLRNALTILEQAIVLADDQITVNQIYDTNGIITDQDKINLFDSIREQQMEALVNQIAMMNEKSVNIDRLMMDLVGGLKDSIIYSHTKSDSLVNENSLMFIHYLAETLQVHERLKVIEKLLSYTDKMKFSQNQSIYFEVAMVDVFNSFSNKNVNLNQQTELTMTAEQIYRAENNIKPQKPKNSTQIEVIKKPAPVEESVPFEEDKDIDSVEEEIVIETQVLSEVSTEQTESFLTVDDVVRYMVTADKAIRIQDDASYQEIDRYKVDLKWARASRLISGGKLVLSSHFFAVIALINEAAVREVAEQRNQIELYNFSQVLFGDEKQILAITQEMYSEAVSKFLVLSKENALPEPMEPKTFHDTTQVEEREQKDESLEKVKELFGGIVEIIES